MKFLSLLLLCSFLTSSNNILDEKLQQAQRENKNVLLYFSGSDWCGACLKLKNNVLETPEFTKFCDENLVWVALDFPQRGSSTDPYSLEDKESLAEKYNPQGTFPLLVLLNQQGEVLSQIKGYKGQSVEQILKELKK